MICTTCMTANLWFYFAICFTLFLITSYVMSRIAKQFCICKAGANVPFSIMDLELPVSERELVNMVLTMPDTAKRAVRRHLAADYLFMLAVYPGIALLCCIAADRMKPSVGAWFFWALAALQIVPWLFDVMENSYLARKLNKPVVDEQRPKAFHRFVWRVQAKFVIAVTGAITAVFALLYYWLTADFNPDTPWYLLFMLAESLLFVIFLKIRGRKQEVLP
ncbi:hypothetical protein MKQ68_08120 [Chitinophaga horti]|uniref:Uncharacterized protein n=1 Tax=Chitinophaga horti TaxID=2920382 RepID=A0ABY6J5U4_9BACT|nr:hypothetical protein [Chitinophaga horti]UYQ95059.1 hypothetical protein MKQ68_08120 [Chitinophaga horti]